MEGFRLSDEEWIRKVTRLVVKRLTEQSALVPIGVSNRHVHLSRQDMDILFGTGSELTKMKDLKQPGQFAAEECVTIRGPRGEFQKVRILGPLRKETQVELSVSDTFRLGIPGLVRESGKLEGSPGIEIIGPERRVTKDRGAIVALRHIHMPLENAAALGLKDKDTVSVEVGEEGRPVVFKNVLLRVSDQYALEMHLDMDEANAAGVKNDDYGRIIK